MTIHFTENQPRDDVSVVVVSTMSRSAQPISNYVLQGVVPKVKCWRSSLCYTLLHIQKIILILLSAPHLVYVCSTTPSTSYSVYFYCVFTSYHFHIPGLQGAVAAPLFNRISCLQSLLAPASHNADNAHRKPKQSESFHLFICVLPCIVFFSWFVFWRYLITHYISLSTFATCVHCSVQSAQKVTFVCCKFCHSVHSPTFVLGFVSVVHLHVSVLSVPVLFMHFPLSVVQVSFLCLFFSVPVVLVLEISI